MGDVGVRFIILRWRKAFNLERGYSFGIGFRRPKGASGILTLIFLGMGPLVYRGLRKRFLALWLLGKRFSWGKELPESFER